MSEASAALLFQLSSCCCSMSMWLRRCVLQSIAPVGARGVQPALHCTLFSLCCTRLSTV